MSGDVSDNLESGGATTGTVLDQPPTRTSLLAIAALIVGVMAFATCFVGYVLGIIGNLLAIFALLAIQRSNGRLRGKGAALTGLGLNSIAFLFGIVVAVGAVGLVRDAIRYSVAITAVQSQDTDGFKGSVAKAAADKLTPQQIAEFRSRIGEQLGGLKGVPQKDLIEFWRRISDGVERQSAVLQDLPRVDLTSLFVLPADFEKGRALVIVYVDPADKSPQYALGRIKNLGVVREGARDIIWLFPIKDGSAMLPPASGSGTGSSSPPAP